MLKRNKKQARCLLCYKKKTSGFSHQSIIKKALINQPINLGRSPRAPAAVTDTLEDCSLEMQSSLLCLKASLHLSPPEMSHISCFGDYIREFTDFSFDPHKSAGNIILTMWKLATEFSNLSWFGRLFKNWFWVWIWVSSQLQHTAICLEFHWLLQQPSVRVY